MISDAHDTTTGVEYSSRLVYLHQVAFFFKERRKAEGTTISFRHALCTRISLQKVTAVLVFIRLFITPSEIQGDGRDTTGDGVWRGGEGLHQE